MAPKLVAEKSHSATKCNTIAFASQTQHVPALSKIRSFALGSSANVRSVMPNIPMVQVHGLSDNPRGEAVVDIFRFEDGKIVEHWDVIQSIPETSANNNTMF